jgi:hypothetical protein
MKRFEEMPDLNRNGDISRMYESGKTLMKEKKYMNAKTILEGLLVNTENVLEKPFKMEVYLKIAFTNFHLAKYNECLNHLVNVLDICRSYISDYNTEKENYSK